MADDIVITGMGIMSPIGCGEDAFWESLCAGRSGAAPVEGLDTSELPRRIACQVTDVADLGVDGGRASALAVRAARQAADDAGVKGAELPRDRVATIMGTTMGETEFIENKLGAPDDEWLCRGHAQEIVGGRPGTIAAHVRDDLGVAGPTMDLYGACAAGNMAIALARRRLLDGECDVVLAGGADGFSRLAFLGFMRLRIMAAEVCRPFDQARDGLFVGEGAVVFVLERETTAKARGATIRARVSGTGIACENYHPTRPHPEGDGLTRATRQAVTGAGLTTRDITYVCAHGTGTPQNDAIEVKVMERVFADGVSFSSIKALTGHMMGAAAAAEAACCVLSLEHQQLIPTWHLDNVLEPCSLDAVRGAVRSVAGGLTHVVNNSAGFGGYNASIVLSRN
ncbi:MAG: beta-ketoacyl-[acyl-carrier-protein] synthase family protein [Phycisphaerae bacterium]|jgi:3-oxoacyl-[acyl-carrier-protein] synthase II